jgi:hypothetical protein
LTLTRDDIELRLEACLTLLYNLQKQAPSLRQKHLQWRLKVAKRQENHEAQTELIRIMTQEAKQKRQQRINHQSKKPKGSAILQVPIDTPHGAVTHTTQETVEQACKDGLRTRFNLGQRAPINFGALAQDFGQLGYSQASHRLFNGDYVFPADCDSATRDLLLGIAHMKAQFQNTDLGTDDVTPEDYISFWKSAKEDTASSRSG